MGILILCCLVACTSSKKQIKKEQEAEALRKLGEAYMVEGRDAAAYQKLMEAKELNPNDPYTYFSLGNFYFNKEKYDLAHAHWEADGSEAYACSDQFHSGIAKGSLYYPRIVTAILWMEMNKK